ncbi:SpoIIE family protein phosphatase [Candidatus Dependentiae bacterium]|nr:SpoIIE family protein phosphatase [Candidatus Dependentiae bacterium]
MESQLEIYDLSLKKTDEELCGDKVKIYSNKEKTIIVLSDGLGSGVKANILATMTSEIIVKMLSENIPLEEVINTIISTLPICQIRKIAYATFTILEIDNNTYKYKVVNFDNPKVFVFKNKKIMHMDRESRQVIDKKINIFENKLDEGDFIGIISDGVMYAGLGSSFNFGWGWDNIGLFIENILNSENETKPTAQEIVYKVITNTHKLYGGIVGDDASFAGIMLREKKSIIIFTGPPLNKEDDFKIVKRLLDFNGRKIVCGGTTGNIVGRYLNSEPEVDILTMTHDTPPIARLKKIDLVTEGILTMTKALDYLKEFGTDSVSLSKNGQNGAVMLAKEIIAADSIKFIVGQKINEYYQNPELPSQISIRKNLIKDFAVFLLEQKKEVSIEYC